MMQPGPQLNALVAEHVVGWQWWRSSCTGRRALYAPGRQPEWMTTLADMSEPICYDCEETAGLVGDFPASTDLTTCAAAAEEWMKAKAPRRYWWELMSHDVAGSPDIAAILEGGVTICTVAGQTPAHALSRALLKACGCDV